MFWLVGRSQKSHSKRKIDHWGQLDVCSCWMRHPRAGQQSHQHREAVWPWRNWQRVLNVHGVLRQSRFTHRKNQRCKLRYRSGCLAIIRYFILFHFQECTILSEHGMFFFFKRVVFSLTCLLIFVCLFNSSLETHTSRKQPKITELCWRHPPRTQARSSVRNRACWHKAGEYTEVEPGRGRRIWHGKAMRLWAVRQLGQ